MYDKDLKINISKPNPFPSKPPHMFLCYLVNGSSILTVTQTKVLGDIFDFCLSGPTLVNPLFLQNGCE